MASVADRPVGGRTRTEAAPVGAQTDPDDRDDAEEPQCGSKVKHFEERKAPVLFGQGKT